MTHLTVKPSDLPVNTVRAYAGAQPMARRTFAVYDAENQRPSVVDLLLSKGRASQGYKGDFERREVWWTEMSIEGRRGRRTFGRRFTGPKAEAKARDDFDEAVRQWEAAVR